MQKITNLEGTVIKSTGSWYTVMCEDGNLVNCKIKGSFKTKGIKTTNPCIVGDKVKFTISENSEVGLITEIKERQNCIIRKSTNLSKQRHIIAVNIDQAILVVTIANPRTSTGFIDRFLVTAEAYFIPSIIVFNKIDIYDNFLLKFDKDLTQIYERAGYECLHISARNGLNIENLKSKLVNKVSLFSGHSGVGKSELINKLIPDLNLKTADISQYHNKGRHTTTFAEMFPLPEGGFIIDTPGIKEFGMVNFQKEEVSLFFPEMKKLVKYCQFNNCTHEHEPNCAVKEGLRNGIISQIRYQNYLNIINGREMGIDEWELA